MTKRVSIFELERSVLDLLDRVESDGEELLVERDGKPVCRIVPVEKRVPTLSDLERVLREGPHSDPELADLVRAAAAEDEPGDDPPEGGERG